MKQFEIIIHTFSLKDGLSRLFVHKNKKIKQGSPINFYMFKFNNAEEAVRNIDSMILDKTWLSEIVTASFDFYRNFYNNQFGRLQKEIKKELNKIKAKEKVYLLNVFEISGNDIKANYYRQLDLSL